MAWSTEISQLVTETEQFIDAVETKKIILDAGVDSATLDAAEALAVVDSSSTSAINSTTSADISKGHAAATEAIANFTKLQQDTVSDAERQASLAAGYALSSGTIAQQDLTGMTAMLHRSPSTVTSVFVYDTSKDSDGGAWTEKGQNTSWYNEPLSGKWLGQCFTELAARTYGAVLGPNLVNNGTFDSGTTGWTVSSPAVQVVNSRITVPGITPFSNSAVQLVTVVPGKLYEARIDLISGIGRPQVADGGVSNAHFTANIGYSPQSFRFAFTPTTTTIGISLLPELANSVTVWDNVSIREVTSLAAVSNDYFQLTTDGKIYRLWKNMFSRSAEFESTAWSKQRVSVIPNATTAPDGTLTADKIVSTTVSGEKIVGQTPPYAAGKLFSVYAKAGEISSLQLFGFIGGSRGATFNLNDGTSTTVGGVVAKSTFVGNGWWRCEALYSPGWGGEISYRLAAGTGNDVDGLFLWGAQLELNDVATTYEPKGAEGSISEVFRGNKQDFPRLAGIVSESANVTIYDLTEPDRPMWMRFANGTNTFLGWATPTAATNSVAALSGRIAIGTGSHGHILDFSNDDCSIAYGGGSLFYEHVNRHIAARQANGGFRTTPTTAAAGFGYIIGNGTVNTVAMTVLPDAPTDPVTGLKVPTIALGTNGGMSVIQDEGIARNGSGLSNVFSIAITPSAVYAGRTDGALYYANNPGTLGNNFPFINRAVTDAPGFAIGGVGSSKLVTTPRNGLFRLTSSYSRIQMIYRNTIDIARSIVTTITNTFNTGWTAGDVRRVYLSDTISLPATETELVAYPDMSAVNVGWSENRGGTLVYDGDGLLVTNTTPFQGGLNIPLTLYNGDALRITMDIEASGTGAIYGGGVVSGFTFYNTVVGRTQITLDTILTFPNPAVIFFIIGAGQTLRVRYLSIKRLSADRSHKLARASIVGTLPRTQVASGTSLVGYSGFSAANYIREPYSADLDFGTGEWNTSAWLNIPTVLPLDTFPVIGSAVTVPGWTNLNSSWDTFSATGESFTASKDIGGGTDFAISTNTISVILGNWYKVILTVSATTLSAYGISLSSGTNGRSTQAIASGTGTKVVYIQANTASGNFTVVVTTSTTGSITIDSVSIQELGQALVFDRNYSLGPRIRMGLNGAGNIIAEAFDGTTTRTVATTTAYNTAKWLKAETNYTTDGSLAIQVNGREVAVTRGNPLLTLNSRRNLLTWSEDFSNAIWTKANTTITGGQSDRNNLTTAFVSETTVASNPYVRQTYSAAAGNHTFSIYAKYFNTQWLSVTFNGVTASAWFDIQNGVSGTGIGANYISHSISPSTNGYYRLSVTVNIPSAVLIYPLVRPANDNNTSATTIGQKVYIDEAQLELGNTATEYQRVTTVAETNVAPLTIGNSFTLDAPFPGSISMLKLSATVPTAEQSTFMYEQEKQLFRTDAISVLPDGNTLVDMSYDDATDRWSTVSTTNGSYWTGLVRNSVTPVSLGSVYSKIITTSGIELAVRTGSPAGLANPGADLTIPTYLLREDLNKRSEAASKAFKEIVNFDYVGGFTASTTTGSTAITSVANLTYPVSPVGARISGTGIPTNATIVAVVGTTIYISAAATATATGVSITFLDFKLPIGFETETIATAGAIRREGTTADFTRFSDGFIEVIRFAVAPGVTTWVQIQASRIVS